jgi:hypothetical protein
MSPRGAVTDMKLSDELKAALKKSGALGGGGGGAISEETFRNITQGAVFPAGAVTKGKTWSDKSEADMAFGKMVTNTTLKYLGTSVIGGRTIAKIEMKPKFTVTPKPGAPLAATFADKGGEGITYFDPKKGIMTASDLTQNMEMTITVGGATQTMTMKAETRMRLKD